MLWERIGVKLPENTVWDCFPRCYRNRTEMGWVAHNYVGENEYQPVYWDDQAHIRSFFGVSDEVTGGLQNEIEVHLIVFADLSKIFPGNTGRADENLRDLFIKNLNDGMFGFEFRSIETGLQNVLREYPGTLRDDRMKYVDMHPVHCFRLNMNLYYENGTNC